MEATQAQRRLFLSLSRAFQCQCSISPTSTLTHTARSSRRKQLPSSSRTFSTSPRWHQEASTSQSQTAPSESSTPSSKQALSSYIKSMQTIINGFKLQDTMPSRQHEQLIVALANAEARLNAPGQTDSSLRPLLQSLQGEINPILERRFKTSDMRTLTHRALSESKNPPKASIGAQLDAAFPRAQPKAPAPPSSSETISRLASHMTTSQSSRAADPLSTVHDLFRQSRHSPTSTKSPRLSQSEKDMALNTQFDLSDREFMARNPRAAARPQLRLKPTLGRTVEVTHSADVTRAFRSMESLCARNGVRRDFNSQRFHVRRGQKKKNLRIDRWRKMFMAGFLEECKRVRRMRAQGW